MPNYDTDCLNCARKGEYSSMWNIVALAYLLKVKMEVIYPAVNGSDNYSFINNKRTTSFTQIRTSVRGFFGSYRVYTTLRRVIQRHLHGSERR